MVGNTAAALAARDAASGIWLAELEGGQGLGRGSGQLPRVAAPGLPHGVFGAWAQPESSGSASGESRVA